MSYRIKVPRYRFFNRWTRLPDMPTKKYCASALCVRNNLDTVLVVGGESGYDIERSADVLYKTTDQPGEVWRWRTLNPMLERRCCKPGMIQLEQVGSSDVQKVLVAGGWSRTTEVLKFSCNDPFDCGQWTIVGPLTRLFKSTFLVGLKDSIFAFGMPN